MSCLLFRKLLAIDLNFARKIEGKADLVTVDLDDAYQSHGITRVAENDLFTDTSSQCKHRWALLCRGRRTRIIGSHPARTVIPPAVRS